ncbi:MAG: chloride channel protein, partial [Clostridia bacterium]
MKKLFPLKLLLLSLINGGIIGLFITLFLKVIYLAEETSVALAEFLRTNLWLIPIYLIVFLGVAFLVSYLSKFEKFTRGGGMPQTEGLIRDVLHLRWYYAIPIVTICSLLAIACGISLDNEGPSVLIGACIGTMVTKLFNQNFFVEKYLITGGSGAGLATAFNMPLTGVLFSLEEGSKRFSPMLLLTSIASVFSAIAVSNLLMERSPMFAPIELAAQMHWSAYVVLFCVGIVLGLVAKLFSKSILKLTEFFNTNKYFKNGRAMFLPFILLIPCMLFLPEVMGPGVELINKTFEGTFLLWSLVVLLVVKFAFTALSSSTSLIGGIFIPSLAIEGLAGALLGSIINQFLPTNINTDIFVLAGMVVAFTSIAGSPLTAVVFSVELSQNFNIFFPMICVVLGALLIGQLFKSEPIYEAQLWQMRKAQGEHEHE